MRTVLPGAAISIVGGGESGRLLALAASRMGYRVSNHASGDADVTIELSEGGADSAPVWFAVIAARSEDGAFAAYAPIALDYTERGLDISRTPAPVDAKLAKHAVAMAQDKLNELGLTGIACVEFAPTEDHSLSISGVNPHPSAAGYLTSEAFVTDQFEQHIRAVCGLPLGSTDLLRPVAMAVVEAQGDWAAALAFSGVKLHLHESHGYLTATAASATLAKQVVRAARAAALAPK